MANLLVKRGGGYQRDYGLRAPAGSVLGNETGADGEARPIPLSSLLSYLLGGTVKMYTYRADNGHYYHTYAVASGGGSTTWQFDDAGTTAPTDGVTFT